MNSKETKQLLAILVSVFPSFELTEERIFVWAELLLGEDYGRIRAAMMEYLKTAHAFPPTPGELIDAAHEKYKAEERQRLSAEREKERLLPTPPAHDFSEEQRQKNLRILRDFIFETSKKVGKNCMKKTEDKVS